MTDDEVLARVQKLIRSVWALELILLVRRDSNRVWRHDELVRELRSSDTAVGEAVLSLQASGLITADPEGNVRYQPASTDLDRLCGRVETIYATKPLAVAKAIMTAPNDKLRIFADAFRIKGP